MPPPAYQFRGRDGGRDNNGRGRRQHEFTFRARPPPPPTSARPLLTIVRDTTPEFLGGGADSEMLQATKFRNIDDLTDSDEAEMDVSSSPEDGDAEPPRKKQATAANMLPEKPKWSNPDPYTVLPPIDETQVKRRDFVKMIRKARVVSAAVQGEESKETKPNAVVSNEDFISFGDLDLNNKPPENAPRGPKASHGQDGDPALGSRKRTRDDEIIVLTGKQGFRFRHDGSILDIWHPKSGQNSTPWLDQSTPPTIHLGSMLQNEVLSFYQWVRPKEFEDIVRDDLIARVQSLLQARFFGCQIHAFGSYAAGLYLPVADMDLVVLSRQFLRNGKKSLCQRVKDIYSLTAYLKDSEIAVPGSIEPIAHARVPIIKFRDRLTGLKVDLSFDNSSGLNANKTFQVWKQQFPAMPAIVAVVKQYLLLRGLNEVPVGGLGGFSIICLVTSLLQHLPYGTTEPNLGTILMDFFDFYGNIFDLRSVGIRLDPPEYFAKPSRNVYQADQRERLCIIDPNNPDNDISGGSKEIPRIFRSFSEAYTTLKQNLASAAFNPSSDSRSLLGAIIGADYDSYDEQRKQLHDVFMSDPRFSRYWPPPPAPPASPPPPPPPPQENPPVALKANQQQNDPVDVSKLSKKQVTAYERANRLRSLRPDLEFVPNLVTVEQAMQVGGYATISNMDRDLHAREKARKEQAVE